MLKSLKLNFEKSEQQMQGTMDLVWLVCIPQSFEYWCISPNVRFK